jgi:nuclear mRNA export protein SAC3
MYERAAGDKTLPSDLRPPKVLRVSTCFTMSLTLLDLSCQRTVDYLFHDLLPRGGFAETHTFVRDRSRAVRNDLTMQHETGPVAIECHDRCARFHILALHIMQNRKDFSVALEEQQLMNSA